MTARQNLQRKLALLLGAYAVGLIIVLVGVAALNNVWVVGSGLLLAVAVSAIGFRGFRCPDCGESIFHYSLTEAREWFSGPRQCPFCEAQFSGAKKGSVSASLG